EAVRVCKEPHTKALQKLARRIKFQDRRIRRATAYTGRLARRYNIEASMKHPDVTFGIDMNPDDLSPVAAVHAVCQGRPAFDQPIRIRQLVWLRVLRLLRASHTGKYRDRRNRDQKPDFRSTCNYHRKPLKDRESVTRLFLRNSKKLATSVLVAHFKRSSNENWKSITDLTSPFHFPDA